MSEHQMEELLNILRNGFVDIKDALECIALCMILNTITDNGARKITAKERQGLLKVLNGEEDTNLMLCEYLMHAVRPRTCGGDKK